MPLVYLAPGVAVKSDRTHFDSPLLCVPYYGRVIDPSLFGEEALPCLPSADC